MDIPREQKPKRARWVWAGLGVVTLIAITVGLQRLEPAAPSVERATVWPDSVRRGTMVREVRGPGTLVPEQVRWISAVTAGRVERIHVQPGIEVLGASLLLELSNPDVQVEALQAQRALTDSQAQLVALRTNLETQRLTQEGVVATVNAEHADATRTARNNEDLAKRNLIPAAEVARARERAEELAIRVEVERKRLALFERAMGEQIAVQQEQVERLRAIADFQQRRVESMVVQAGVEGVLAELPLEDGQWVNPGQILARIVQPGGLKAEVRIPETQAVDVAVGQHAYIDTRNDTIPGRVARIDPAAVGGTVLVEVRLEGELPRGARPDLSIQGTVEVDRLDDVLYVGRPAYGQPNSMVGLFKLTPDGRSAERVNVRLGAASVTTVEVIEGLEQGDIVILSDMSQWDGFDRVRIR